MPPRFRAGRVRIDLISPRFESSSLSAPQATSLPASHTVQNVISGTRSPFKSSACLLSGGETLRMSSICSSRKEAISGPSRSSTRMCKILPSSRRRTVASVNSPGAAYMTKCPGQKARPAVRVPYWSDTRLVEQGVPPALLPIRNENSPRNGHRSQSSDQAHG